MAIPSPSDLKRDHAPIIQRHADLLAERLRESKYCGGRYLVDNHGVPYEHQKAVAALFEAKGWVVSWHDDQRDGASVAFAAR